jgi:POT family proton-dependent oligopeptide transporter
MKAQLIPSLSNHNEISNHSNSHFSSIYKFLSNPLTSANKTNQYNRLENPINHSEAALHLSYPMNTSIELAEISAAAAEAETLDEAEIRTNITSIDKLETLTAAEEDSSGLILPKRGCARILPGPTVLRNILSCELCERYSFYALRACLVLYLKDGLGFSSSAAVSIFSYFTAAAYFVPLLGGYISDCFLGKFRTIFYFSLIYCCGGAILSLTALVDSTAGCLAALALIALGTGGIKPCVSSFGADQFLGPYSKQISAKQLETEQSMFFHVFYFCINLGSVFSFAFTPILRNYFGFPVAFGVPSVLLLVALVLFYLGKRQYVIFPPQGSVLGPIWRVYKRAWTVSGHQTGLNRFQSWLDYAVPEEASGITQDSIENARSLYRVLPIFSILPVFWMLFDQQSSSWTLQAQKMRLYGLQPEQTGVVNPICVMLFIPLFEKVFYPAINRTCLNFTALQRIGTGFLISIISFVLSGFVQMAIDRSEPHTISVFWQIPQIITISIAEILISITGLEFAYTEATPQLKSTIAAVFLITTAIGNVFTGILYDSLAGIMDQASMLFLFAGLMGLNLVAYVLVARKYHSSAKQAAAAAAHEDLETMPESAMISTVKADGGNLSGTELLRGHSTSN